jgi:cardiolipin synthase
VTALRLAAARGVLVELVIPDVSDNLLTDLAGRGYFAQLLEAKVHIYLNKAGMLHAKTMTVDDGFSMIGSANFDIRSFFLNFELNLLLYEEDATAQLRFCQTQYIADSAEVVLELWKRRPLHRAMTQNAAMLLSPLL